MTQDFLDQVERQLVDATEHGAKRRRFRQLRLHLRLRLPTFAVAAVTVTAVTATALAAELGLPAVTKHSSPLKRPAVSASGGAQGASQAGFEPESFTAISEFTWWLLGTRPCGDATCVGIARTEDGGQSFVWTPVPSTGPEGVDQLRFADSQDGYAFGPQLWSTHDGGASWQQINLHGTVISLVASGPFVYAEVAPEHGQGKLMRSPVGSDSWVELTTTGAAYSGLWAQGSNVLVDAMDAAGNSNQLLISHDYGASFTAQSAPPAVVCNFEQASSNVIWEPCVTGTMSGIWRSTNGGATYTAVGGDATEKGPQFPNSMAFAAASPSVAVMGYQRLYRTVNGGRSYAPVPTPRGIENWDYLGFTDATHGVALGTFGNGNRLYYTINAGSSYHYVPIDPT